jgi:hypothetical protein
MFHGSHVCGTAFAHGLVNRARPQTVSRLELAGVAWCPLPNNEARGKGHLVIVWMLSNVQSDFIDLTNANSPAMIS